MVPSCSLPVYFLEPLGSFDLYFVFYRSKKKKKVVERGEFQKVVDRLVARFQVQCLFQYYFGYEAEFS